MKRWITLGVVLGLAVPPRSASSCTAPQCLDGWTFPPDGWIEPTDERVPANIGGILMAPRVDWGPLPTVGAGAVRLTDITAIETDVPVSLTDLGGNVYLVVPLMALVADHSYRIDTGNFCTGSGETDETADVHYFETSASATLPTALGALSTESWTVGDLWVESGSGSCVGLITAAQAPIYLTLDESAVPWKDALYFSTWVDGVRWTPKEGIHQQLPPGGSWRGRGEDLLFHRCDTSDPWTDPGLAAGKHTVVMRAALPGHGGVDVETPPIEVELLCSTTADGGPEDGAVPDAGPEDGAVPDAGPEDGTAADAGPEDGTAADADAFDGAVLDGAAAGDAMAGREDGSGVNGAPAARGGSSGCDCAIGAGPRRRAASVLLALLVIVLGLRPRRSPARRTKNV